VCVFAYIYVCVCASVRGCVIYRRCRRCSGAEMFSVLFVRQNIINSAHAQREKSCSKERTIGSVMKYKKIITIIIKSLLKTCRLHIAFHIVILCITNVYRSALFFNYRVRRGGEEPSTHIYV